jgi:hypothetical protein
MGTSVTGPESEQFREVQQMVSELIAESQERLDELSVRCHDYRQAYFRLVIEQNLGLGSPQALNQKRKRLGCENAIKAWKAARSELTAAEDRHQQLRRLQTTWQTEVPEFVYEALGRLR